MTDKTSNSQKPINRREMLKKGALAAGGAITAAAFLDEKWIKPIVKTGILPVHAQASCGIYTFNHFFETNFAGYHLGVNVVPVGPDGPISYEIIDTFNVTFNPGPGSTSGTLSGGTVTFPVSYSWSITGLNPTFTIQWTYDGFVCTQTYEAPSPIEII